MKRLTIRLDDDLHRRLRFLSLEANEPLQQMALRLLRAELERHEAARPNARPKRRRTR